MRVKGPKTHCSERQGELLRERERSNALQADLDEAAGAALAVAPRDPLDGGAVGSR